MTVLLCNTGLLFTPVRSTYKVFNLYFLYQRPIKPPHSINQHPTSLPASTQLTGTEAKRTILSTGERSSVFATSFLRMSILQDNRRLPVLRSSGSCLHILEFPQ